MYLGCNISTTDSTSGVNQSSFKSNNCVISREPLDVAVKRRFFRQKSKTILGPDAFNQAQIRDDRNVLERSQSCDSPTKRFKNNENQNRKQYFSNLRASDTDCKEVRSLLREKCAKSSRENVCLEVTVEVHHSQHPTEVKLASLASIDEILEFEQQEMAQLETAMMKLGTVETMV